MLIIDNCCCLYETQSNTVYIGHHFTNDQIHNKVGEFKMFYNALERLRSTSGLEICQSENVITSAQENTERLI